MRRWPVAKVQEFWCKYQCSAAKLVGRSRYLKEKFEDARRAKLRAHRLRAILDREGNYEQLAKRRSIFPEQWYEAVLSCSLRVFRDMRLLAQTLAAS